MTKYHLDYTDVAISDINDFEKTGNKQALKK